jgi:class 3 adenylate cyclase
LTVDQLWEAISNTDRLNQGLGLPFVTYEHKENAVGGVDTFASFKLKGLVIRWREHPYEWVKGKYFEIERDYFSGPMKNVIIRWELEAKPDGGSILRQKIRYTLKHWAFWPIAAFQFQVEAKLTVFGIYKRLNKEASAFAPRIELKRCPPMDKKVQRRWTERLRQVSIDETHAARLLEWVQKNSPTDMVKIRHHRLAKELGWDSAKTLSVLLRATDAGAFVLTWGLLCPGCRGTKLKKKNLSELPEEGHCTTCNIHFGPDFSKNIELTFRIASAICETSDVEFCAGGPQNTPHSVVQLRLKPGQKLVENFSFSPGTYQVRSLQSPTKAILNLTETLSNETIDHSIKFTPAPVQNIAQQTLSTNQINITLENHHAHEIVTTVEKADWLSDICSAFDVVNTREFRDLFPTQVISKSVEFKISSIAIMFTDLKDSTAMYEKVGDAQALDIVVNHLETLSKIIERNQGFVVKTIGDAIMAVFQRPENAAQAAIDIQLFYLVESQEHEASDLHVKIGIHKGPCFAVNLNERNDFFGGTVNIAARTQSKSGSDEIILTAKMVDDPGVKEVLLKNRCELDQIVVPLRGLAGEYELYELKLRSDLARKTG